MKGVRLAGDGIMEIPDILMEDNSLGEMTGLHWTTFRQDTLILF
jgi:hypothetical protein